MTNLFSQLKGLLFDIDGVLYVGDQVIPGAIETIAALKARQFPCRFVTNTTTQSLSSLQKKLVAMGFAIDQQEIISPPSVAVEYLRRMGQPTCWLLLNEDTKRDFKEFASCENAADAIVIGEIGDVWDYDLLNKAFAMIIDGAQLIALHKGRYWQVPEGLRLGIGAFVASLEYATGKQAVVVGKPSSSFFQRALDDLQLSPCEVAMIGDDVNSDIGGAQQCGMAGILVKTGKYRRELVACSPVQPDMVIESIADVQI